MKKIIVGAALVLLSLAIVPAQAAPRHKLLVVSIDGLDWRYIRDRDALGLKIPTIRMLLTRSLVAEQGVVGVWPTVTWPSHTTMLTGVRPDQHGILANASGPPDPALNYWSAAKIKVPTLWQCAGTAGLTTAAINWPVTVNAAITYDLPEVYTHRNGDSSDLETVMRYGTPGLVDEIARFDPSFPQAWFDDRSRTLAVLYLLKQKQPDLLLVHLAELDSESHAQGPFTVNAKALVERSDALLGDILHALPKDYDVALVSDHGFERIDRLANPKALAAADGVTGAMMMPDGGIVTTTDKSAAAWLRGQSGKADGDIGREIPHEELMRYAPDLGDAVGFEPAPHVMFTDHGEAHAKPGTKGNHGFWPRREDYRSILLLSGPGVTPGVLGPVEMIALEDKFSAAMGLNCPKQ